MIGRSWSVPYILDIPSGVMKSKGNHLIVKVTNLDANRMIWLDKKKAKWQQYFFVDITYGPFDASNWTPLESGLVGKLRLETGD